MLVIPLFPLFSHSIYLMLAGITDSRYKIRRKPQLRRGQLLVEQSQEPIVPSTWTSHVRWPCSFNALTTR